MKKKIFIYYFILILLVLIGAGIFSSFIAQKYYKYEVENKLKSIAYSIEYYIMETKAGAKPDYNQMAKDLANVHNENKSTPEDILRVTFIDYSGKVLGDSEANYTEMENHLSRKEVQEALKGSTGSDIRRSKTINIDLLYVAIPIKQQNVIIRVSIPLTQLNKIDEMIWFYSILVVLAGIILTITVSLRITNSITRPLKDLIIASKEISNGNYSKRIDLHTKDELGQLAANFNDMASELDSTISDLNRKKGEVEAIVDSIADGLIAVDSQHKIIIINPAAREIFKIRNNSEVIGDIISLHIRSNQINVNLEKTIKESISTDSEVILDDKILKITTFPIKTRLIENGNSGGIILIQDITQVRKLEQLRTDFVSNVTHELKTPITSIRGFIETLKNGSISNEKVASRFLDIIDIEAERLYALISDILELSEIETKSADSDIENLDLKSVAESVFEVLQNSAGEKHVSLQNLIIEKTMIKANKYRMKQLLLNLVDNGIKYNNPEGIVSVHAFRDSGQIIIVVKDTGIGIPEDHLPRIFERFYRVDKGRSREQGGTGLGLSIVKHIVNLYNGDIRVNSEVGKGTEFIIKIPD